MKHQTNLKVSLAHLTTRPKQGIVAVLSVTFGISMYVFMNGFMDGVNDTQTDMAFSTLAHIRVYNDTPVKKGSILSSIYPEETLVHVRNQRELNTREGIRDAVGIMKTVLEHPEVTGVAPQVNLNVFFQNGAIKINGRLSGVDVEAEDALFGTSDFMVGGSWFDLGQRGEGIVLGVGLAQKLGVSLNDNISILTADGVQRSFAVIGLNETTINSVDNTKGYVRLSAARQLLSKNRSYVTEVQVNIKDFDRAEQVAAVVYPNSEYIFESWSESNGQLVAGNELRNIIAIAVSLTILLVAGFGIYNIMNMTVNEKMNEIAILKAMGFEGGDIINIFLTQSMIIGSLGGFVGLLLGNMISRIIDHVPFEVAGLKTLPMAFTLQDYLAAFGFGLITTFVAGYLPAKKAARVDPVEIIRG